ncbi:MAG: hypothetical protein BroJett003_16470 [Planctomycetota bacterium]|nr:MAG: hypothetical protein BroJett003_16470 [Planctomycetota bacterium]
MTVELPETNVATDEKVKSAPAPPDQARADQIAEDVYCPACAYNLRTLTSNHCPECGLDIAFIRSAESHLPWMHRDKVGPVRAYLMTVWMVVFRTKHFCLEMSRPVDEVEARRFRRVTITLAFAPFLLFTLVLRFLRPDAFDAFVGFGGYTFAVAAHAAILAAILTVTVVPYYVIRHPDIALDRQRRAAALTLYCPAPLSLTGVAGALAIAGIACANVRNRDWDLALYTAAVGVFLILAAVTIFDVQRVIRWMLGGARRSWPIILRLYCFGGFAAFLCLVGFPAAVAFVMIVVHSLS